MPSTERKYKLRRGTVIYTTGFILPRATLEKISSGACSEQHKARFGNDLVFGLQWHVERFVYELMPMRDPKHPGCYFFGISFFPYTKGQEDDPTYRKMSSLSEETMTDWYERYGKHSGIPLEVFQPTTVRYSLYGLVANFLPDEVYRVVRANKDLWHLVEPVPSIHEVLAQVGTAVNARKIRT